ncbi:recombinase family protein [Candidatus Saccharibacteria bacterium]|nr:MAG: recombinase family protein [Candidatus Saccharibacteria bacterium]
MNDRKLETLRYRIYARKSTDTEDKQVQSLDDQVTVMRRLAKAENLKIIGDPIFEAKSAKKPNNRPAFEELIEEIESGKIDGIMCWKIDRLSRNPTDSGRIQQLLQDGKLQHIRTNEKSYFPEDNAIVFSVEAGMSNQYVRELAVNTRRGMELKAERGHKPGIPPIGYLNDRINKVVIPDPDRFHLVRILWDKMLTGTYSIAQLQHFADSELQLTTVVRTKVGGNPIAYSSLCAMFKNEFYTGVLPFKGQILPGKHDAMITKEEFEKVQQIIDPTHTTRPKDKTYNFQLRNLFKCGECGFAITAEEKRKTIKSTGEVRKYIYYHCTGKNKVIKCTQTKLHVSEDVLLEQIKEKLCKFTIDPDFYKLAIEALAQEEDIVVAKDQSLAESHNKAITKAEDAITRLRRMRYNGEADDDAWYLSEMKLLEDKLEEIQGQRNDAEYKARDWRAMADEVFTFARYAKEDFDSDDLEKKRAVVFRLGEVLTIKDRTIQFTPNKYFIPLEQMNERQNNSLEMVRTNDLQIKSPAFQHGSLSWLRRLGSNQ